MSFPFTDEECAPGSSRMSFPFTDRQIAAICQYLLPSVCIITEQEVRQQAATSAVVTIRVSQLPSFAMALGS